MGSVAVVVIVMSYTFRKRSLALDTPAKMSTMTKFGAPGAARATPTQPTKPALEAEPAIRAAVQGSREEANFMAVGLS